MSTVVRRSLLLATVVATLIGGLFVAAPAAAAAPPPVTHAGRGHQHRRDHDPQLERLMSQHRLTSVDLVEFYLHRIKRLNPELHAIITVSPRAMADARHADALRRRGDRRTLLGIPIIVKDNIDTTGMPTTAGSWALAGSCHTTRSSSNGSRPRARSSSPRRT